MDYAWKRVRIMQWTPSRDVIIEKLPESDGFQPTGHQLFDNLIGVSLPAEAEAEVVTVIPKDYISHRECITFNPEKRYYRVPVQWIEILGDAYADEVEHAMKAVKAHGLEVETEADLMLSRVREFLDTHTATEALRVYARADYEKEKRRG